MYNVRTMPSETHDPTRHDAYADAIRAWRAERARGRAVDRDYEPDVLAPPPCFGPNDDGDAARSPTVRSILLSENAGSNDPITPERLQAALTATVRQFTHGRALRALLNEADIAALLVAHDEGAFTWRRLANAVYTQGVTRHTHFAIINRARVE